VSLNLFSILFKISLENLSKDCSLIMPISI